MLRSTFGFPHNTDVNICASFLKLIKTHFPYNLRLQTLKRKKMGKAFSHHCAPWAFVNTFSSRSSLAGSNLLLPTSVNHLLNRSGILISTITREARWGEHKFCSCSWRSIFPQGTASARRSESSGDSGVLWGQESTGQIQAKVWWMVRDIYLHVIGLVCLCHSQPKLCGPETDVKELNSLARCTPWAVDIRYLHLVTVFSSSLHQLRSAIKY